MMCALWHEDSIGDANPYVYDGLDPCDVDEPTDVYDRVLDRVLVFAVAVLVVCVAVAVTVAVIRWAGYRV